MIAILDAAIPHGHDAHGAWKAIRGELRARRRQSEQGIPAVSSAAQHFVAARVALDAGIDQLTGFATPPSEDV